MPARLTKEQVMLFANARELQVELPTNTTKRQLSQKYHLFYDPDEEGDNQGYDFFWNQDLRSACGFVDPEGYGFTEMILFPEYYVKFEPQAFLKLLHDAESITVRVPGNRLKNIEWPKLGF